MPSLRPSLQRLKTVAIICLSFVLFLSSTDKIGSSLERAFSEPMKHSRSFNQEELLKPWPKINHKARTASFDTGKSLQIDRTMLLFGNQTGYNKKAKKHLDEKKGENHRDATYSKGKGLSMEGRLEVLVEIMQAWSRLTKEHGIISWISHGTLIGWWFNQRILPFDSDLDLQTLPSELPKFAKVDQQMFEGRFFLNVNPNAKYMGKKDKNTIDARFIDTRTGYFMDLTVVGAREEFTEDIYSCSTPHYYTYGLSIFYLTSNLDELFPLVETIYENVTVWRPNQVISLIVGEYGVKALMKLDIEKHNYSVKTSTWNKAIANNNSKDKRDAKKKKSEIGRDGKPNNRAAESDILLRTEAKEIKPLEDKELKIQEIKLASNETTAEVKNKGLLARDKKA
jgi:hypothetical protein